MKNLSAAIIVAIGFAWYYVGFAVRDVSLRPNEFSDYSGTFPRVVGVIISVIGLMGWALSLGRDHTLTDRDRVTRQ
jgi:hypothetical protein